MDIVYVKKCAAWEFTDKYICCIYRFEIFTLGINNYLAFRDNPTKPGNIIVCHSIYQ